MVFVDRNIRLKEGIELIKFAVSQEPQNGFYLDSLGWAYYKLNDLKKAIVYLERAIELEPQEMEITDHLGDAYFKRGRLFKRSKTGMGEGTFIKWR